eukprot:8871127-Pyramimonas_sp.AAC.1
MPRSTRLKELVRVVRQLIEHILNAAVPTDQRSELFKVLLKSKWPGILEADDVQDDITKNTAVIALSKSYKAIQGASREDKAHKKVLLSTIALEFSNAALKRCFGCSDYSLWQAR